MHVAYFSHPVHLVHRSQVHHPLPPFQRFFPSSASNSAGVNFKGLGIYCSKSRRGTIATTKNGKAKAIGEDLTAHKTPSPNICTMVKKCIFHVLTLRTYETVGWYLTGLKSKATLSKSWIPLIDETPPM